MNYADFGKRLLAYVIDSILISIASTILNVVFNGLGYLFFTIAGWLYFAGMESSEKQATFGKIAMGINVVDLNGDRLSFGRATGRYFAKYISAMTFLVGYIMAAFTQRRQALHDMIAGTLVVDGKIAGNGNSYVQADSYSYQPAPPVPPAPRRGNPVLYGITGDYAGRSIPIDSRGIALGRDPGYCHITFPVDAHGISRRHCTVQYNSTNGCFVLLDIGSSYGTFLESGMKVMQGQAVVLKPGERFYIGNRNNLFEVRL